MHNELLSPAIFLSLSFMSFIYVAETYKLSSPTRHDADSTHGSPVDISNLSLYQKAWVARRQPDNIGIRKIRAKIRGSRSACQVYRQSSVRNAPCQLRARTHPVYSSVRDLTDHFALNFQLIQVERL
jgi:hypothetical protein